MDYRDTSNSADVIDSRDVIERIAELEAQRDDEPDTWGQDDDDELVTLQRFAAQGEDFADWQYGEVFVRDSYFEEYARQLAEDIGAIPDDAKWPATCIDWEKAANQLRADYSAIEYDGVTYWARS